MKVYSGKGISPGYAEGTAVVHRPGLGVDVTPRRISLSDVARETDRFRRAVAAARSDLRDLEERVRQDIGATEAAIFASHGALLADAAFTNRVEERIDKQLVSAETALDDVASEVVGQIESTLDEYLRQRGDDVRDLERRVLAHLVEGAGQALPHLPSDSVLVAAELLPSETVNLDRANVRALVLERCGRTSHAAILAKALGIPAVSDLEGITGRIHSGMPVLVDGTAGTVTVHPSADAGRRFGEQRAAYAAAHAADGGETPATSATSDGVRIRLMANLGRVSEAPNVRAHHLAGVGLFRTEVLFLGSASPPAFEVHRDAYAAVAETLDGLPLVIRTLDLGGDKCPAFLPAHAEHNPTLGLRGLRYALRERQLLRTQLAAILDVARHHDVRVMFPMVLGGDDMAQAVALLRDTAAAEGYAKIPPVGATIETPASLFSLDEILAQCGFISIGTNDLTQFILAADRDAAELIDDYSLLHPSVLRAVQLVVSRADAAGCPVSVCGEAAGDPQLALVLVGLGVRELSMSPARAGEVRRMLRGVSLPETERIARDLLACPSLQAAFDRLGVARPPAAAAP